jgi:zinc protease
VFSIDAELDPEDTDGALHAIAEVVRSVRELGITDEEAARARNIIEARMLRSTETAEGQANLIASWQARGDWRLADEYLGKVLAVTAKQLHDAARRYLDPDALTLLLYRPESSAEYASDPVALQARLFPRSSSTGTAETAASRAGAAANPAAVPGTAQPGARTSGVRAASRLSPRLIEDGVRFYVLPDSGVSVVVKPRTTTPLVSVALCCRGGVLAERADTAGMTGLMARTSVKGTRSRTGVQLAEESEALGASISPGASFDTLDWSISLPSRHFDRGVELLLDAALEPAFRAEDAERERKVTLSNFEQLRDDMHQYPMRLALAAAFGGHPYGFEITHLEQSIRDADLGALGAWHDQRVLHGAPFVLVVGDISDPDAAAGLVANRMEGRIGEPAAVHTPLPVWPDESVQRVEHRDKAQTALVLAFPGPPRNHPDVHALQLLSAAVSGLGGRLFEELRSKRSLAYAVSASPMPRAQGGAFIAYIGMAPEREEEARAEMMRELLRTAQSHLESDELERARRYLIGSWRISQQTNSRQLADLAGALLLGEGLAELRDYVARIEAITAEHVRAAAERWIRPDRVVEAVVRGKG